MIKKRKTKTDRQKIITKLDKRWSEIIRRYGVCEYCGTSSKQLHSHHIYSRANLNTRWDLTNGICLCVYHHIWSTAFSAHLTPSEFLDWLRESKEGLSRIEKIRERRRSIETIYVEEKLDFLVELGKVYPDDKDYMVSDDGRIWSIRKSEYLHQLMGKSVGYVSVCLSNPRRNIRVHRMVMRTYKGECPEGMDVHHIDGDKTNNDLNNLKYAAHKENMKQYQYMNERMKMDVHDEQIQNTIGDGLSEAEEKAHKKRTGNSKLTPDQVRSIRTSEESAVEASIRYKVSVGII